MQAKENTTDSNDTGTSIEIDGTVIFQVLWLGVVIAVVAL